MQPEHLHPSPHGSEEGSHSVGGGCSLCAAGPELARLSAGRWVGSMQGVPDEKQQELHARG